MKPQAPSGESPQAGGPFPRALRLQRQTTDQGIRHVATPMEPPMPSPTDRALSTATSHASALARDNTRLRAVLTHIQVSLELHHATTPGIPVDPFAAEWPEPDRTIYALAARALATETPHREW